MLGSLSSLDRDYLQNAIVAATQILRAAPPHSVITTLQGSRDPM
jgi:hypothetical protein